MGTRLVGPVPEGHAGFRAGLLLAGLVCVPVQHEARERSLPRLCLCVVALLALGVAACSDAERDKAECAPLPATGAPQVADPTPAAPAPLAVDAPKASAPTVTPAPAPAPETPEPSSNGRQRPSGDGKALVVKKIVIGKGVEKSSRSPVGVAQSFKKGDFEKLYAFVELANPGEAAEVVVSFDPPSDQPDKGNVRLAVGTSPRWRTWATSRGIDEVGTWTAVVTAPDGRELAREAFEVL
jgi:hypothetical protein